MGWRYLDIRPDEVLSLTHKEFTILLEEQEEKNHDNNEQQAMYAIMYAAASRGKGKKGKLPKLKDLYDRDAVQGTNKKEESFEDIVEKQRQAERWLSQFDLSGFDDEDEDRSK